MSRPSSAIQIVRPSAGAAVVVPAPGVSALAPVKAQGNGGLNVNATVFGQPAAPTASPDKRKGE